MSHGIIYHFKKLARNALRVSMILLGIIVIAYALYRSKLVPCIPTNRIVVNDTKLWVCVADIQMAQTAGLSHSRYLPRGWGMLFVFDEYSHHMFWMKDMKYSIDILWLDDNLVPVEVARNASPASYPGLFSPLYANRFVLETLPGVIDGEYKSVPIVNN